MHAAEILLDGLLVEVDDGGDDVAWALAPELHDIFAEIGLDHLDARGLWRWALSPISSDTIDLPLVTSLAPASGRASSMMARASAAVRRVMHLAAALDHLALISLEIKIEMRERVVLDGAGLVAQRVELGQFRLRRVALDDETALDVLQRLLQARRRRAPARRWP